MKLFLIVDAWDRHHCFTAQTQIELGAPFLNHLAHAARASGYQVVHSPAGCMDAYARHPSRTPKGPIRRLRLRRAARGMRTGHVPWPDETRRPPELDGPPCACMSRCRPKERIWSRQHAAISILPEDIVAQSVDELRCGVLGPRTRLETVLLSGFHLDQCVLTRRLGYFSLSAICSDTAVIEDAVWSYTDDAERAAAIHRALKEVGIRFRSSTACFAIAPT